MILGDFTQPAHRYSGRKPRSISAFNKIDINADHSLIIPDDAESELSQIYYERLFVRCVSGYHPTVHQVSQNLGICEQDVQEAFDILDIESEKNIGGLWRLTEFSYHLSTMDFFEE